MNATIRVGSGHDTHRIVEGRPLILGGVHIKFRMGLAGHSDADVVLHALTDALLGAAGLGDIGELFPDNDPANKDRDSAEFLAAARGLLAVEEWEVANVDCTIFAQEPKLGPHKEEIRGNLAALLHIDVERVNVKAKTGEGVGHIGRGEAIGAHVVVLIQKQKEC